MLFKDWDVVLIGKRFRITPVRMEDDPVYGRLLLGKLYDECIGRLGEDTSRIKEILNHTEKAETHAIRPLDDDSFIGWICLQKDSEGRPDIGVSLIEEYRNRGIGPEATALFANRLYSAYGIDRVYIRIYDSNTQSLRASSKLGAVFDKREPDDRIMKIIEGLPEEIRKTSVVPDILFYHIDLPIHVTEVFKGKDVISAM